MKAQTCIWPATRNDPAPRLDAGARRWLAGRFGPAVCFDEPMHRHTSLRVGGPADAFAAPATPADFMALIEWARQRGETPVHVIGKGTNLLVGDVGIRGVVVALDHCLNGIRVCESGPDGVRIRVLAGTSLSALCAFALRSSLAGINFAIGIPGSVGGGLWMNAGTDEGTLGGIAESVGMLLPDGKLRHYKQDELNFDYRRLTGPFVAPGKPVLLEAVFRLRPSDRGRLRREAAAAMRRRKSRQPLGSGSAGCFFKNPPESPSAGALIEQAGLKGARVGGAAVSERHANFIINTGGATAADVMNLAVEVQAQVLARFGIALEAEVQYVAA